MLDKSQKKLIVKNTFILNAVEISSKFIGLFLTIVMARKLGVEQLGLFGFAMAFAALFRIIPRFGFNTLVVREVSRNPKDTSQYFINIAFIKTILALATFLLVWLVLQVMGYPQEKVNIILAATLIVIFTTYLTFSNSFFRAHQKTKYEAFLRVSWSFLNSTVGISIILMGFGLLVFMISQLAVIALIVAISCYFVITKLNFLKTSIDFQFCNQVFRKSLPFVVTGLSSLIYMNSDTVMLFLLNGDAATGWYTAAKKVYSIFIFISMSFMGAFLPAMSKLSLKSSDKVIEVYRKAHKYLLIISIPIVIGISALADRIILVLYGTEYSPAIWALRILIWALVFKFINDGANMAFFALDKEKTVVKVTLWGACINIALNLILIPWLGLVGACIATVISRGVVYIITITKLVRYHNSIKLLSISYKPLLGCAAMTFTLYLLRPLELSLVIALGAISYFAVLFLIKTFRMEEIQTIITSFRTAPKVHHNPVD